MTQQPSPNSRPLGGPSPRLVAPEGTVDCHMHIFPEGHAAQAGGPPIAELATVEDYAAVQAWLGVTRAVVVQSNAHQFDDAGLVETLGRMDPGTARGVASVAPGTDIATLRRLDDAGVRGARIMDFPGGAVKVAQAKEVEEMVRDLGWSLIVQFNGNDTDAHLPILDSLECDYTIDHVGKFIPPVPADDRRVDAILRLLDKGNAWVKISAPYETSLMGGPDYADVGAIAKRMIAHAPERTLWASNWPHVGVSRDAYPDDVPLLDLLLDWATPEQRQLMLVDNPQRLYFER